MNTATCHICHQSVPLDDSGRLAVHRPDGFVPTYPEMIPDSETCRGSGATSQAPDVTDKTETPLIVQRCAQAICNSFAVIFAEQGIAYKFDESKTTIEEWIGKCVASETAQAREKIAGLEKDGALLDLFDAHDLIYEYTIAGGYGNWHKVHRISGYGLLSAERAKLPWHKTIRAALDAARDKKG